MIKFLYRHINIILVAFIALVVIAKLYRLNHIDLEFDLLQKRLDPIKSRIKQNSKVGFYTNQPYAGANIAVQYVMAPQIISNSDAVDTLIVINSKSAPVKPFPAYHTIAQNDDGNIVTSLITKSK